MKLYEISQQFAELEKLAEDDASMIEAVSDTMELITADFEEKAQAVVLVAKNMDADITVIDAELKRLTDKKKAILNRTDWLRNYLRNNMENTGISVIECPLFKITLSKPTRQVSVDDESALSDDYVNVKAVVSPDKRKILADLKAGIEIKGASLVDGTSRLTIK